MRLYEFANDSEIGTGWFTPDEKYLPCLYGDHGIVASKIAGIKKGDGYYTSGELATDKLLDDGYLRIEKERSSSIGFSIQVKDKQKSRSLIRDLIQRLPMNTTQITIDDMLSRQWKNYTLEEAEKAFK